MTLHQCGRRLYIVFCDGQPYKGMTVELLQKGVCSHVWQSIPTAKTRGSLRGTMADATANVSVSSVYKYIRIFLNTTEMQVMYDIWNICVCYNMYIYIYIYIYIYLYTPTSSVHDYALFAKCVTAIKSLDTMRMSHKQVPVAVDTRRNAYASYVRNLKYICMF